MQVEFYLNIGLQVLLKLLEAGLDVASGLHSRLAENEKIKYVAQQHNRQLFDIRYSDLKFATGKGTKRSGKTVINCGDRLFRW